MKTVVASLVLVAPLFAADATIWYVNCQSGTDIETGTSWQGAYRTIQPAIDAAHAGGGGEIWVAHGIYEEQRNHLADGENTGSLVLKPGIALYGGFAGTEKSRDSRDWEKHRSTISGAQSRDGQPAYQVIIGAEGAVLDGFSIRGGHSRSSAESGGLRRGAGILCDRVSMTIENCVVAGNISEGAGGGVYAERGNVILRNCRIERNTSLGKTAGGGGIFLYSCPNSLIADCTVVFNRSIHRGGGIYCENSSPTITNTHIASNSSARGGGLAAYSNSHPKLIACHLEENQGRWGGALRFGHNSSLEMRDSIVSRNSAHDSGGGVSLFASVSASVDSSRIERNHAPRGGGIWLDPKAKLTLKGCSFEGNQKYAIGQSDSECITNVSATHFADNEGGVFFDKQSGRTYATVAELDSVLPTWDGNVQDDEPFHSAPIPAAVSPSAPSVIPEETAIEVSRNETRLIFKGSKAVISAFVIAFVLLLGGMLLYLHTSSGRSNRPRAFTDDPELGRETFVSGDERSRR